jgi:hypothetical protein
MSNPQNVAEMKVAEPTQAEKATAAAQYEIERKARMDEHRASYDSMTSEERAEAYRNGNMEKGGRGYRKKSRKGKKSKTRNTRRRRGRRSRKHRMR